MNSKQRLRRVFAAKIECCPPKNKYGKTLPQARSEPSIRIVRHAFDGHYSLLAGIEVDEREVHVRKQGATKTFERVYENGAHSTQSAFRQ